MREGRDKRVQQSAREKLREHQQATQASEERQRTREAILAEITQHAGRQVDNLYGPRLAQLRQQWQQASEGADGDAQRQFNEQAARCEALLTAREQAQAEQARKATLRAEQQAAMTAELLAHCKQSGRPACRSEPPDACCVGSPGVANHLGFRAQPDTEPETPEYDAVDIDFPEHKDDLSI